MALKGLTHPDPLTFPPLFHAGLLPACRPPRGPAVAGGVEHAAGQQPLRHPQPVARVDLRPVGEGPVGAVPAQLPAAGQPAQALPHRPQLRLAVRLRSHADANAAGRSQVSRSGAGQHDRR